MGELQRKLKKLRKMPVNVAAKKISCKLYDKTYHTVKRKVIKHIPVDINSKLFENFEPSCLFLFNTLEKDYYSNKLIEMNLVKQIIEDADKICKHEFNLLGSGNVELGTKIPWHNDFKANYTWKNQYYEDIIIVDLSNNADVKVPWELSRFQHLFTLGKAYWITNSEKYAKEFVYQIEDWIEKNPVEFSVNWTCAMEVAIRAVNWINGYYFFKDSPYINNEFWMKFNKSLYFHGRFIIRNLENGTHTGNHYLSDIVGLAWLGLYFCELEVPYKPLHKKPSYWLEFAIKELEKEMLIEVNKDGTNYEGTTAYHRLVTELFLLTTILLEKNSINFSSSYKTQLEKMCEFLMDITKPNGYAPLIGDTDNGRFIILSNFSNMVNADFTHILYIAGEYFNRDDFKYLGQKFVEDSLWVLRKVKHYLPLNKPIIKSKAYHDGGFYILRNEIFHCVVRCGELSFRGLGDHSHNDQLSFELNINGKDFIVDPGTFMYTGDPNMRNLFRSTEFHNTILIEKQEQNHFNPQELFLMKEQTNSKCRKFTDDTFIGEHYGYVKKTGHVHKRSIHIQENKIIIEDFLQGPSTNNVEFILNLSPKVKVSSKDDILYLNSEGVTVRILGLMKFQLKKGFISPSFGIKEQTKRIVSLVQMNYSKVTIEVIGGIK